VVFRLPRFCGCTYSMSRASAINGRACVIVARGKGRRCIIVPLVCIMKTIVASRRRGNSRNLCASGRSTSLPTQCEEPLWNHASLRVKTIDTATSAASYWGSCYKITELTRKFDKRQVRVVFRYDFLASVLCKPIHHNS
jgi:hypothetical protein